jgi:hypothetical protein
MHEQHPQNLPLLDRLTTHIPGYGGYQVRGQRRAAERALRDAVASRLDRLKVHIDESIRACVDRNALTEINALERIQRHIGRLAERVRAAGSGTDDFYSTAELNTDKANPIYAIDLTLFEQADNVARVFDQIDPAHDRLAHVEECLNDFEKTLDERALLIQGIR